MKQLGANTEITNQNFAEITFRLIKDAMKSCTSRLAVPLPTAITKGESSAFDASVCSISSARLSGPQ